MKKTNILNNENDLVLIGAARLMEDIFESGLYRGMKTVEKKLDCIKKTIRKQFENGESKRYELPHDVIVKFVPSPVYETDELGLKEFLNDYGLLPQLITLKAKTFKDEPDILVELTPFQEPMKFFAQFYLNSKGKLHLDNEEYFYEDSIELLAINFLKEKSSFENDQKKYKKIMGEISACPFLRQSRTLKSTYGTCRLRSKDVEFNTQSVYNELGSEFLINYGQVSLKSLEDFIAKGYFSSRDIMKFRKVIDIKLRCVVMEKDKEIKQSEFFHQQIMRKTNLRRFA
ncbi:MULTISPECIES: hypothetical protein [Cytobacillus]|uniref:Uncharacterized protein n=1 Tax=Cytobacillus oceanisediminis TaxID=665099 RepID=A0ABX3CNK6_9BACI|nr:hypothetical protein [Cytobacillus oceanisediminis]EFV75001.1 hypothetical protein HMPREF1013_04774 [Bacillus sp. 2_A_57_CT2]MCM3402926.1 hypothetical protein [Cytobacillus oceanisediminis]OHX45045.1 hypothetical protein BBV17_24280 [Cytobacillus oceanisediminis]